MNETWEPLVLISNHWQCFFLFLECTAFKFWAQPCKKQNFYLSKNYKLFFLFPKNVSCHYRKRLKQIYGRIMKKALIRLRKKTFSYAQLVRIQTALNNSINYYFISLTQHFSLLSNTCLPYYCPLQPNSWFDCIILITSHFYLMQFRSNVSNSEINRHDEKLLNYDYKGK